MRIAVVGNGRLGRSLAALLPASGHEVAVWARGQRAANSGEAPPDVVLVCVPDEAIAGVARELRAGPVVLHCAGARDLSVLAPHVHAGSLHPLMTFPGPEVALPSLSGVPAAVAGDPVGLAAATALARDLGLRPFHVPGDRRLYHAAAVLAGNVAIALLAEAGRALAAAGVPEAEARAILAPLAIASLENAVGDPAAALTGPVARGDHAAIAGHRAAFEANGLHDVRALYDAGITALESLRRRGGGSV